MMKVQFQLLTPPPFQSTLLNEVGPALNTVSHFVGDHYQDLQKWLWTLKVQFQLMTTIKFSHVIFSMK